MGELDRALGQEVQERKKRMSQGFKPFAVLISKDIKKIGKLMSFDSYQRARFVICFCPLV